jgi:hypothetical protein
MHAWCAGVLLQASNHRACNPAACERKGRFREGRVAGSVYLCYGSPCTPPSIEQCGLNMMRPGPPGLPSAAHAEARSIIAHSGTNFFRRLLTREAPRRPSRVEYLSHKKGFCPFFPKEEGGGKSREEKEALSWEVASEYASHLRLVLGPCW